MSTWLSNQRRSWNKSKHIPIYDESVELPNSEPLRISEIWSQPAVAGLTSGLHLKNALLCQKAPLHSERMLTDVYINMMMLFYRTMSKTFKVMWGPGGDTNSKQAFRISDVSAGETQTCPSEGWERKSDVGMEQLYSCWLSGRAKLAFLLVPWFKGIGKLTAVIRAHKYLLSYQYYFFYYKCRIHINNHFVVILLKFQWNMLSTVCFSLMSPNRVANTLNEKFKHVQLNPALILTQISADTQQGL